MDKPAFLDAETWAEVERYAAGWGLSLEEMLADLVWAGLRDCPPNRPVKVPPGYTVTYEVPNSAVIVCVGSGGSWMGAGGGGPGPQFGGNHSWRGSGGGGGAGGEEMSEPGPGKMRLHQSQLAPLEGEFQAAPRTTAGDEAIEKVAAALAEHLYVSLGQAEGNGTDEDDWASYRIAAKAAIEAYEAASVKMVPLGKAQS